MPTLNFSRSQISLACAVGGSCIISVPAALHYTRGKNEEVTKEEKVGGKLIKVKETITEQRKAESQPPRLRTKRDLGGDIVTSSLSEQSEEVLRKEENSKKFEELWVKITEEYGKRQKNQTDNQLSWKTELRDILLQEKDSNNEWKIIEEEYKDCTKVSGGRNDYCGYLALTKGSNEYRLKFDRYGKGGGGKKWDISVVRKVREIVQYYSKTEQKWSTSPTHDLNNFQGESSSRHNWWGKLTGKSIEI